MTKLKLISMIACVLLLINVALLLFFFTNKPRHRREEGPRKMIIEKLHFNNEQVKRYEELILKHRKDITKNDSLILIYKKNLYTNIIQGNSNTVKDSLLLQLTNIQTEIETINYAHFEDIKKLCKPEQQKYYNELILDIANLFNPKHPK